MSGMRIYPWGEDKPSITFEQAVTLAALKEVMELDRQISFCSNACCLQVQETGFDENTLVIGEEGGVLKVDRYGNTIEELSFQDMGDYMEGDDDEE